MWSGPLTQPVPCTKAQPRAATRNWAHAVTEPGRPSSGRARCVYGARLVLPRFGVSTRCLPRDYLTRAMIATTRLAAVRKTCHRSGSGHRLLPRLSYWSLLIDTTCTFSSRSGTQACGSRRSANWRHTPLSCRRIP